MKVFRFQFGREAENGIRVHTYNVHGVCCRNAEGPQPPSSD